MSGSPDFDGRNGSLRLWVIGVVAAVLLHAGAVGAALYQFQPDETGDGPGDDGMEVSLELALPNAEPTEVPPGPDSNASAASPALAEQKAIEKEADLPKEIPQETAEPDRVVAENTTKKPDDEQPEKAQQQQQASQESVAAEEAQRQKLMGDKRRATAEWSRRLSRHLEKHKRYPTERTQKAAEVTVSFTLDRVGHVQAVSVVKSSGDAAFDEAALAMVRRSDPVPAPPAALADEGLSFTVPVIFTKGKS